MSSNIDRIVFGTKGPKWKRTAFVSGEQVFLPAMTYFGSDAEALMCAGYDGVEFVRSEKHVYLTAKFLAKEFPEYADKIAVAAANVLEMKQQGDNQ